MPLRSECSFFPSFCLTCRTVRAEMPSSGALDPEEQVAAMMEEMRSNGFDEIVAEAQAQIDAYFAG